MASGDDQSKKKNYNKLRWNNRVLNADKLMARQHIDHNKYV